MNNEDKSIQEEVKNIKKKILKVLSFGFLALLLCLTYWIYFEESFLTGKSSPSGKSEVVINEYGNWIAGGSDTVKFYFKTDGKTKKTKKVDVSLMESNHEERYNIVWTDENRVSISMDYERSNQGLSYNFSTNTIEIE